MQSSAIMGASNIIVGAVVAAVTVSLGFAACSPTDGGDGETDGGIDASADTSTDAPDDRQVDAPPDARVDGGADAGEDAGADAGEEAGVDAGADAGEEAGVDAGADAGDGGTGGALYAGAVVDFDVDATNLYLLLPPSTIAKCPVAGCGAAAPTTVRANSKAAEIEAGPGVVYFGYRDVQRIYFGQVNEDGTAFSEDVVFLVGGPYTLTFKALRLDRQFLYGSVKQVGFGQIRYNPIRKPLPGSVNPGHTLHGGPIYDVRGDYKIEYFPGMTVLPEDFTSYDRAAGVHATYPIPATKPAMVTINAGFAAMVDTTGMPYFCRRVGCVDWTWVPVVANAVAMDAAHLYLGTDTDVVRCAVAEMSTGSCTPVSIGATGASVAQLVLRPGAIYARTTAPAVVKIDLP